MKNFTSFWLMLFAVLWVGFSPFGHAQSANTISPVANLLDKSQASGQMPTSIDNAGNNRGAAFDGERVFVASRQNGNHVYYWNVNDPDAGPQELDITGISGGTFPLSDLAVAGGKVFLSNMVFVGGTFKIYTWSALDAAPTVLLEYPSSPARLGDAITVVGDPATEAKIFVSGHGTKSFYVWTIQNGVVANTTPEITTYDHVTSVNFARITRVPGNTVQYVASGPNVGLMLLDDQLQMVDTIPASWFPGWAMHAQVFEYNGVRYLGYVHVKTSPVQNVFYALDLQAGATLQDALDSLAQSTFMDKVAHSANLGSISNGNASAGMDITSDALGNVYAMSFSGGNGFLVQRFGDAVPISLDPISTVLNRSQAAGLMPTSIDNAGNNRGAAFNGEYVFVASRQNGNHVYYWNANDTTAAPGELNITGVSGGTFPLSDLAAVDNNVFLSNMVFVGGTFKVYHWDNLTDAPSVLLEYPAAPARLGDAITVTGDPSTEAKLIVSGHGTKSFYVWTIVNDSIPNTTPEVYTYNHVAHVNFGRVTKVPGDEGLYLAGGPAMGMWLLDEDFNLVDTIGPSFFPGWPMHAQVFSYNSQRMIGYVHVRNTAPVANTFYALDINRGTTLEGFQRLAQSSVANKLVHSVSIGTVSNGNASVGQDIIADALGNVRVMAFAAGNGFLIQQFGDAVPASLEPVNTLMDRRQVVAALPTIIDNAGNNRGAAFDGRYVYVASRQNGNHVYYWDIMTPSPAPQELNITGVSGGTFVLSDLAVAGGDVFLSNMVFVGGTFKVYHWDTLTAQPSVILEYPAAPARLGDAITVTGDPATSAKLIVSGHGTKSFYVWDIVNGAIPNTTPAVYTYDHTPHVNFGRITKVPGADTYYLASGPAMGMWLLDDAFGLVDTITASYFPGWPMHAQMFEYNNQRFIGYVHVKTTPAENAFYVLDASFGSTAPIAFDVIKNSAFLNKLIHTVNLGNVSNGNASVGMDIVPDQDGNVLAMAYAAGNGFIVQSFGGLISNVIQPQIPVFQMFPNPASHQVMVEAPGDIQRIFLYDFTGKMVGSWDGRGSWMQIPTRSYKSGAYIVVVHTDRGVSSRKLIIQN